MQAFVKYGVPQDLVLRSSYCLNKAIKLSSTKIIRCQKPDAELLLITSQLFVTKTKVVLSMTVMNYEHHIRLCNHVFGYHCETYLHHKSLL